MKSLTDKHKVGCMCGECVYKNIPRILHSFQCKCQTPDLVGFHQHNICKIGMFCRTCGKPQRYALVDVCFNCEGCGKFFTYDFRKFLQDRPLNSINATDNFNALTRLPLPYSLCEVCDAVPTPSNRPRRAKFTFN